MTTWITGYEGRYSIERDGSVWSHITRHGKPRSSPYRKSTSTAGRRPYVSVQVGLCRDGIQKGHYVHRLVAAAFIPNPDGKAEVNHIDGDRLNNHADNLEWTTHSENHVHSRDVLGRTVGETNGMAKLTWEQVQEIRRIGSSESSSKVGKRFGVGGLCIGKILRGERWVKGPGTRFDVDKMPAESREFVRRVIERMEVSR